MPTPSPKYFKAWIIFFLIATVGGGLVGAMIGFFLGATLGLAQVGLGTIKLICGAVGFLFAIPVSYFTFRWAVGEFIVKDLKQAPPPPATQPPPL